MKITTPINVDNVQKLEDIIRYSGILFGQIKDAINGKLSFVDNIDCSIKDVTFPAGSKEVKISHNLNAIPAGYVKVSGPNISVYDGDTDSTKTDIYLKATGAGVAKIIIFG